MTLRLISYEELKQHTKSGDYWLVIEGKVHNVSSYLIEHPGGG